MRAFRLPITAIITALALSGCMRATGPVAFAPQGDLDSMAYGQPGSPPPQAVAAESGGAIGALRAAFAASPRAASPPPDVAAAHAAYVEPAPVRYDRAYHLDAGDKLRVVVYGQEGLTNTYAVSAGGSITMPLIGSVMARGRTTAGLAAEISAKLRAGFIREPSVAVEIEAYRPFFILGEVAAPGQYPYVPNMTAESAVAIAGGFSPRARRDRVTITHTDASGTSRFVVSPASPISPGDTVLVGERWF
ncbi:polysaccharide export protein [Bradyrhizobium sp. WSM 1738]|uniref:polysaccharide biosynthesis/export family protein n=1 Tax=Bradyrhizobium hereditatis TaxID=2821405 RepID=UPI001CE36B81|nr:polysaccharide biosynthesis/export family protein [Bradyrhizobium hereditatis]MCA6119845.1 polysaccharide export protein [Bradyrhizobium hereditatis]